MILRRDALAQFRGQPKLGQVVHMLANFA
jgi:hypothetical protein